jgi:chromosome partitioning protein
MAKTRIITVGNQKGGVGKTTTAVSLAHGMAIGGKNVLLIDLDPQGQSASFLGLEQDNQVYKLLAMPDENPKSRVRPTGRDNLWIIPGNQDTSMAQIIINAQNKEISYIRDTVKPFTSNGLDYIIFDTAPSVGGIQERAIWAADMLIIVTATESASTEGASLISQTAIKLNKESSWQGGIGGTLPTLYDEQTRESKATVEELNDAFSGLLLSPIHRATALRECVAHGKTIFEHAPESRAAEEYRAFVKEVLRF